MTDDIKELKQKLIEANARRAELEHAMEHILSCTTGTVLCKDCKRLAKASLKGIHWVHFKDNEDD